MDTNAYRALLSIFMEADPWPFSTERKPIEELLDKEAQSRGFEDWVDAYHLLPSTIT